MLQKNTGVPHCEMKIKTPISEAAKQLLTQSPPNVTTEEALALCQQHYGAGTSAKLLTGERDKNFLLQTASQRPWVLKFINSAESNLETDLQIQVLHWLAQQKLDLTVPENVVTGTNETVFSHVQETGDVCQVRAYTYVEGLPVNQIPMTEALQYAFGQTAAKMAQALCGFEHEALERVILWDVMSLGQLQEWALETATDDPIGQFTLDFLVHFQTSILPRLQKLPYQVIHADLSQSNMVVSPNQHDVIAGVLDFGDMVRAPRVLELGIAASYALDVNLDIQNSLMRVLAGFESVSDLTDEEKALFMDVVVARLVQRIIITQWRAKRFPENASYILRATQQARDVLALLMPHCVLSSSSVF